MCIWTNMLTPGAFTIHREGLKKSIAPPPSGTFGHPFFTPFFSFAIESYILYETDLALYILLMLWLLTATYYVVYESFSDVGESGGGLIFKVVLEC